MHVELLSPHIPIASAYLDPVDYDVTHFISGLNHGGFLNTFFTWFTFTADTIFMVLIIAALYVDGYRKEALVFAIVFLVTNVLVLSLKDLVNRPRPMT